MTKPQPQPNLRKIEADTVLLAAHVENFRAQVADLHAAVSELAQACQVLLDLGDAMAEKVQLLKGIPNGTP